MDESNGSVPFDAETQELQAILEETHEARAQASANVASVRAACAEWVGEAEALTAQVETLVAEGAHAAMEVRRMERQGEALAARNAAVRSAILDVQEEKVCARACVCGGGCG